MSEHCICFQELACSGGRVGGKNVKHPPNDGLFTKDSETGDSGVGLNMHTAQDSYQD